MADDHNQGATFNLTPDPRILPMLGQISIDQWRCLAELIDNSVDGFISMARAGTPIDDPRINITLPASDKADAIVRVTDNGPGMGPDTLERAVRAGWSGNGPLDNLGLFGVGFNIATARLGAVTQVFTTRAGDLEWYGLEIAFQRLNSQGNFTTPRLTRPKQSPDIHGTEVIVSQLKPDQRQFLAKGTNQTAIRKRLSQVYASMLVPDGIPIGFKIFVGPTLVKPRRHCVWSEERGVVLPDLGKVSAVVQLDRKLAPRVHCSSCLTWLPPETDASAQCPACGAGGALIKRERRITGWLGVQRYLDTTDFGLDFIRNGRKIELGNKDLFIWPGVDGDEREYPVDDQRSRGRIVGEVHVDHVRVDYVKERFDRTDPAWGEMIEVVRGDGPLRPEKAKALGYDGNTSPLFKLFKAFRRSTPQSKVAGSYARLLVVSDNNRAKEMAEQFHDGVPKFESDAEWWKLVEEADRELLVGEPKKHETPEGPGGELPPDLLPTPGSPPVDGGSDAAPPPTPEPVRRAVSSLTRKFTHQASHVQFPVEAFSVGRDDPDLPEAEPWVFMAKEGGVRQFLFLFDEEHPAFASMTLTPKDALLAELAMRVSDFLRGSATPQSVPSALAELRSDYADDSSLDIRKAAARASDLLAVLGRAILSNCPEGEEGGLFEALSAEERKAVAIGLATRRMGEASALSDGSFLAHPPFDHLPTIIEAFPQYCFDGAIWDETFITADFGDADITDAARQSTLQHYLAMVRDAIWLSRADVVSHFHRDELIRALMSVNLLMPDRDQLEI